MRNSQKFKWIHQYFNCTCLRQLSGQCDEIIGPADGKGPAMSVVRVRFFNMFSPTPSTCVGGEHASMSQPAIVSARAVIFLEWSRVYGRAADKICYHNIVCTISLLHIRVNATPMRMSSIIIGIWVRVRAQRVQAHTRTHWVTSLRCVCIPVCLLWPPAISQSTVQIIRGLQELWWVRVV